MKFPFQAILKETPDPTAAAVMTVGKEYTVHSWAGSCFVVDTDNAGETAMVYNGRFEKVPSQPVTS